MIERSPENKREEILQRSPYTNHLLNSELQCLSQSNWESEGKALGKNVLERIKKAHGDNWHLLVISTFLMHSSSSGILDSELSLDAKFSFLATVIGVGFEIGNKPDVEFLFEEVNRKFTTDYQFTVNLQNHFDQEEASDYIFALLRTGVFLRMIEPKGALENFIETLDLDGI